MQRIVMLLSNAFRPDPRVAREAAALSRAGYEVMIIAWDRRGELPAYETKDGYRIERVQTVRSVYGGGMRQILNLPRFWREAIRRTMGIRPDIVHCHDLDTLPAGWWLKRLIGAKLIYDAHEDYPAMMSLYLPALAVRGLAVLERYLLKRVDYIITASTFFADKLRRQGIRDIVTIGNYRSLAPFDALGDDALTAARKGLGLNFDDLVVVYIGGFSRNRMLIPLIETARMMPDVQFLLWGGGHQKAAVEEAVKNVPNAHYLGWLPSEKVPLYTKMADIIYYCLLPDYPGAIYNAPNTLSNAMAAGRPVIANDVGDLGRIVRETGCGVLLPEVTPEEIRKAIEYLCDPKIRKRLGGAGRRAAEEQYSWNTARRMLIDVYKQVLNVHS